MIGEITQYEQSDCGTFVVHGTDKGQKVSTTGIKIDQNEVSLVPKDGVCSDLFDANFTYHMDRFLQFENPPKA
jgi:hypothetical protein